MTSRHFRGAILLITAAVANLPVPGQQAPFIVHETKAVIMSGPYLLAPTETSATIVWTTDTPCHSKVVYGTGQELTDEVEPVENGMVPIGVEHVVRLNGLQPGRTYRYRAVSTRVVKMKSYRPEKGLPVESPTYSFTTFDRKKASVSFSLIVDTHDDVARVTALTKMVDWKNTDFFAHLGDGFDGVETEGAILDKFLDPISKALDHCVPLIYARGNHDTRGAGARSLMQYVPIPEGRFYYARDEGPLHLIVLDTGEDKDDNTNVYSHLNRFKGYRDEEFAWLQEHVRVDPRMREAPFRVLLMHAPNWGWVGDGNDKWTAAANESGIDLAICGHLHRFGQSLPGQKGKNYHELVIGQDNLARVDASAMELKVAVTNRSGAVVESFTVPRRRAQGGPGVPGTRD